MATNRSSESERAEESRKQIDSAVKTETKKGRENGLTHMGCLELCSIVGFLRGLQELLQAVV